MGNDLAAKLVLLDRLLTASGDSAGWIIEKCNTATFAVRDDNDCVLGVSQTLLGALDLATTGLIAKARRVLAAAP